MKKIFLGGILFVTFSFSQAGQPGDNRGTPCPGTPAVTYAGKTYNTVQIGSQCWLKENLDVGTMIQAGERQTNNGVIEKYCYNNNTANCDTFGGLYKWDEAMQYSTAEGTQGICPPGWHIPTNTDIAALITTLGGSLDAAKAMGLGWGGGAETNTSGFSALLAGACGDDGTFHHLGDIAFIWSSTEGDATTASDLYMDGGTSEIHTGNDKVAAMSVRCIKD
jgi:uncharacterized protein (TIGR02145 family)